MPRVKRGTTHVKRRKNILKLTKGHKNGAKNLIRNAKTSLMKAGANAYRGRKEKKRESRKLWNVQINAATRANGTKYSAFINALKKNNVELDRKVLAELANNNPEVFTKIVEATR